MYTWNVSLLYAQPSIGICAVSGDRATGRFFFDAQSRKAFISDGAAPYAVEDWAGFEAALRSVNGFKSHYPKRELIAEAVPPQKKKKKR